MTLFSQLYWQRRFGRVRRFHSETFIGECTVYHHSASVAAILIATVPNASSELLQAAILHDMEEGTTGDIPAPVKWQLGGLSDLETSVREHYQMEMPPLTDEEKRLLKAADYLDGVWTCLDQRLMGNRMIDNVFSNYEAYAGGTDLFSCSFEMGKLWADIRATYRRISSDYNVSAPLDEAEKANFWQNNK